jgi:hypothetical protein
MRAPSTILNGASMRETTKYNIRYVGFESLADGARRLDYAITAQGAPARSASILIPGSAFSGPGRVTFQESSAICYEKLKHELETQSELKTPWTMTLTAEDIEQYRPRKRAATKRP